MVCESLFLLGITGLTGLQLHLLVKVRLLHVCLPLHLRGLIQFDLDVEQFVEFGDLGPWLIIWIWAFTLVRGVFSD